MHDSRGSRKGIMKTARSRIGSKQSTGWQKRKNTLWQCPRCRRRFANRNQSHFCGRYELSRHFDGKTAEAKVLFNELRRIIQKRGPVTILPEKTRIAFQTRMSFAAVSIQKSGLSGDRKST